MRHRESQQVGISQLCLPRRLRGKYHLVGVDQDIAVLDGQNAEAMKESEDTQEQGEFCVQCVRGWHVWIRDRFV